MLDGSKETYKILCLDLMEFLISSDEQRLDRDIMLIILKKVNENDDKSHNYYVLFDLGDNYTIDLRYSAEDNLAALIKNQLSSLITKINEVLLLNDVNNERDHLYLLGHSMGSITIRYLLHTDTFTPYKKLHIRVSGMFFDKQAAICNEYSDTHATPSLTNLDFKALNIGFKNIYDDFEIDGWPIDGMIQIEPELKKFIYILISDIFDNASLHLYTLANFSISVPKETTLINGGMGVGCTYVLPVGSTHTDPYRPSYINDKDYRYSFHNLENIYIFIKLYKPSQLNGGARKLKRKKNSKKRKKSKRKRHRYKRKRKSSKKKH